MRLVSPRLSLSLCDAFDLLIMPPDTVFELCRRLAYRRYRFSSATFADIRFSRLREIGGSASFTAALLEGWDCGPKQCSAPRPPAVRRQPHAAHDSCRKTIGQDEKDCSPICGGGIAMPRRAHDELPAACIGFDICEESRRGRCAGCRRVNEYRELFDAAAASRNDYHKRATYAFLLDRAGSSL